MLQTMSSPAPALSAYPPLNGDYDGYGSSDGGSYGYSSSSSPNLGSILGGVFGGLFSIISLGRIIVSLIKRRHQKKATLTGETLATGIASPSLRPDLEFRGNVPVNNLSMSRGSSTSTSNSSVSSAKSVLPRSLGSICRSFTYEELAKATDNFSEINFVGQGGFGPVFKGELPDGKQIAVKQLNFESIQGESEFQSEIEIIGRVHHRHLVSLVGHCVAGHERLLAYEYMENNSLAFHLHGQSRTEAITIDNAGIQATCLDWAARMRIAIGSAKGLAYLHEDCVPRIIHRDIKSANILLDSNFRAKVSDFGIAKCLLENDTHVSTRIMGTIGYLAPEYGSTGKLTDKSDVYSFGVVLLELISGQKALNLVQWARPLLVQAMRDGIYDEAVDPKLDNAYNHDEMKLMIVCAIACVHHAPEYRPSMFEVARVLEGTMSIEDLKTRVMSRATSNGSQRNRATRLASEVEDQPLFPSVRGSNVFPLSDNSNWV